MGADARRSARRRSRGRAASRRPGSCRWPARSTGSRPSASSRSRPGRPAVGVGVDDDLGAAGERRVAGRVHVAEDHVGLEALLEDRVGAAVDADQHRAGVLDVGAQRAQVAAVGRAADDDQRVAVAELGAHRREARACRAAARPPRGRARSCSSAKSASASLIRSRWRSICSLARLEVDHLPGRERPSRWRGPRRPATTTSSPSLSSSNSGAAGTSTSATPARARISGPGFG